MEVVLDNGDGVWPRRAAPASVGVDIFREGMGVGELDDPDGGKELRSGAIFS